MEIKVKQRYTKDDKTFLIVELIIAFICMFIPLILYFVNENNLLNSLSAYIDMKNAYVFGLLLTMAAMMFIFNGALYFKVEREEKKHPELIPNCVMSQESYNKKRMGKWYNIVFGLALIGIIIFPYNRDRTLKILHFTFAGIFFLGSALTIFFIQDPEDRWKSRLLAIGSLGCLGISIYNDTILSLFWSETIALFIIGFYYILESRRIWLRFK